MYIALHIATALAVTSEPFLPFTSEKLKRMLNFSTMEKAPTWQDIPLSDRLIPQGHTIGESVLLFEKIEDEAIEKQIAKLEKSKQANKQAITKRPYYCSSPKRTYLL